MSRVIGGSSSFEAYNRMLDEIKQKHNDQKASESKDTDKIRAYQQVQAKRSQEINSGKTSSTSSGPGIDTYA